MTASPFYVDTGAEGSPTFTERFDSLPQNIQDLLISEDTAKLIWNLCVVDNGLTVDQVKTVAHAVREVLSGDQSAADLRKIIGERLGESQTVTDNIVKTLTQKLISPNYFQISQVWNRRRTKSLAGKPLETLGPKDNGEAPQTPSPKPSANVVNLKNKNVGSLPPPPPVAPKPQNPLPPGKRI